VWLHSNCRLLHANFSSTFLKCQNYFKNSWRLDMNFKAFHTAIRKKRVKTHWGDAAVGAQHWPSWVYIACVNCGQQVHLPCMVLTLLGKNNHDLPHFSSVILKTYWGLYSSPIGRQRVIRLANLILNLKLYLKTKTCRLDRLDWFILSLLPLKLLNPNNTGKTD
jgi:hypothetical protein